MLWNPRHLLSLRAMIASPLVCADCALHHTQPGSSLGKGGYMLCLATWPGPVKSNKSCRSKSLTSLCVLGQRTTPKFLQLYNGDNTMCLVGLLWGLKEITFEKQNFWHLGKEWMDSEKFASCWLLSLAKHPYISESEFLCGVRNFKWKCLFAMVPVDPGPSSLLIPKWSVDDGWDGWTNKMAFYLP